MNSFQRFKEKKLPARNYRKRKIDDDDGKKLDGHITFKNYLTCEKICNKLTSKIWVIITIFT